MSFHAHLQSTHASFGKALSPTIGSDGPSDQCDPGLTGPPPHVACLRTASLVMVMVMVMGGCLANKRRVCLPVLSPVSRGIFRRPTRQVRSGPCSHSGSFLLLPNISSRTAHGPNHGTVHLQGRYQRCRNRKCNLPTKPLPRQAASNLTCHMQEPVSEYSNANVPSVGEKRVQVPP
ncbi:hypothetical protein LIA77_06325 [Sarocladium implicatum]|nr:hypothetical protein LIA77_06325 [Sarocladium implicatum]